MLQWIYLFESMNSVKCACGRIKNQVLQFCMLVVNSFKQKQL